MPHERETAAGTPDSTREWLLQLERRVTEIERENARARRRRRRSFWYFAVVVILYLLVMYYVSNVAGI